MTNKTQIMRHEFERTNGRDHRRQPPKGNNYTDPMAQADWESFQKGWSQALAVPAEDVRAAVDEPVAYLVDWSDTGERYGIFESTERMDRIKLDGDFKCYPLYNHPPRQVVMPERRLEAYFPEDTPSEDRLWNSFCDEFARLNPEISK